METKLMDDLIKFFFLFLCGYDIEFKITLLFTSNKLKKRLGIIKSICIYESIFSGVIILEVFKILVKLEQDAPKLMTVNPVELSTSKCNLHILHSLPFKPINQQMKFTHSTPS